MYTDAKFMLALLENTELTIAGHTITYTDPRMPDDLKEKLKFIVDLYDTLEMIGFETSIKLQELEEKSIKDLVFLVNIRLGKYNNKLSGEVIRHIWHFQGKCVPLLIIRQGDAQQKMSWQMLCIQESIRHMHHLKDAKILNLLRHCLFIKVRR